MSVFLNAYQLGFVVAKDLVSNARTLLNPKVIATFLLLLFFTFAIITTHSIASLSIQFHAFSSPLQNNPNTPHYSMEKDTASSTYQSKLKSQLELLIDFEEDNRDDVDDGMRTFYPCPFFKDDFDLLELCCHIDLEHPIDATSGVISFSLAFLHTSLI
ncbi:hypothetical protein KIW84_052846 [Lathyrus oleraceus]|uniref:Uncharacterized protein n=1 Tax=Pisum sativum TaxID=3888 RepID=A0A9D4WPR6_PEA|nr:hypothetical protein KIW84_052846 [Pisum sativum]